MEYSIEMPDKRDFKFISSNFMQIGDIGIIRDGITREGHFILRAFNSFIDLTDPSSTWNIGSEYKGPNFKVELLKKHDQLVLTIK